MGTKRKTATKKPQASKVHGIENIGLARTAVIDNALHNPEMLAISTSNTVSNPMEYIDKLQKMSPHWSNIAQRVLCSTIGWYAVSAIMWAYRKGNAAPKVESSIDWLNDSINARKEQIENERVQHEQGHAKLPFVDGLQFLGVYKWLFNEIQCSPEIRSMELPSPAQLYARMQRERDSAEALASYEKFENDELRASKVYADVVAKTKDRDSNANARARLKAQDELDHIHSELASVRFEPFNDDVWSRFPQWTQFRIARSVYNQIVSAIVAQDDLKPEDRIHKHDLIVLGSELRLELEAADRMPEVRLAFEQNVLKDQHRLVTLQ